MEKHFSILHFEFAPADDPQLRNDGYGKGMLILDGSTFWFSNTERDPQPVEWTWIDFLEHIAAIWAPLISEQVYPFEWLSEATPNPGAMWQCAESRWTQLGDVVADEEEPVLDDFHRRHNLAAGWKGISLPALFCLRVGDSVVLSPENGIPLRVSFTACKNSIQSIGDTLAGAFDYSANSRVISAIRAWRSNQET